MRTIVIHPRARDEIRRFPKAVRERIGRALYRLQVGDRLKMPLARPMPDVARAVYELRVTGDDGAYRAFYYTLAESGVLVFHAFVKKTQRTAPQEIRLARVRLQELLDV